jgi:hypothetical protein
MILTQAQLEEVMSLLEGVSQARKARAADGTSRSVDEIVDDPQRRQLLDYLYSLSSEERGELITLMLIGRGDVKQSYEAAVETRSKYATADDQVSYLMSKTFRLAEYLRIGLAAILD